MPHAFNSMLTEFSGSLREVFDTTSQLKGGGRPDRDGLIPDCTGRRTSSAPKPMP